MDSPTISPAIQRGIQSLCRQISVAHDLDLEIQRELYGHMEDKLLAYLAGEEVVTEEDAFILVREHFGDPAIVKDYLRTVHAVPAGLSLARRLLAVMAVTTVLSFTCSLLARMTGLFLMSLSATGDSLDLPISTGLSLVMLVMLLFGQPLILWLVLRRWQVRLDQGEALWIYRLSTIQAALMGSGILLLWMFQAAPLAWLAHSLMRSGSELPFAVRAIVGDPAPILYSIEGGPAQAAVLGMALSGVLQAAIWFWWCDRPPRTKATLNRASTAWLGFMLAPMIGEVFTGRLPHHGGDNLVAIVFVGFLALVIYRARRRRVERKTAFAERA